MTPHDATLLAAFDAAEPMAVLAPLPPFRILACNHGFGRLIARPGVEPAAEGRPLGELLAPGEPGFEAALASAASHLPMGTLRHSRRADDGVMRHYELTLSRVPLAGRAAALLCQVHETTALEHERRANETERTRHAALLHLAENTSLDRDQVAAEAVNASSLVCEGPAAFYHRDQDGMLRRAAVRGATVESIEGLPERMAEGHFVVVQKVFRTGPALPDLTDTERRLIHASAASWLAATPVTGHDRVLGVIVTLWRGGSIPVARLRTVDLIANQSALALERALLYDEVETQRGRLEMVLQQMPDGVWMVDASGRLVVCNAAARALLGAPPPDGARFLAALERRVRPQGEDPGALGLLAALAGQTILGTLNSFERGEPGQPGWLLVSAAPVFGRHGEIVGAVAVATDVSERTRAERALALLADVGATLGATLDIDVSLATIAELCVGRLGDWCRIDLLEPDGAFRRVGEAPGPHPGRSMSRPVPTFLRSVIESGSSMLLSDPPPHLLADIASETRELPRVGDGGPQSYAAVPMIASGRIVGLLQLATIANGLRLSHANVQVAEEVARRSAAAVETARLFLAIQESDRHKDEFIALLSHELRTPLTSILGWAQLLGHEAAPDRIEHGLEVIDRNARMQLRLVNDLLDLTAIRLGKLALDLAPIDLQEVAHVAVEAFQGAALAKQLRLEYDGPAEALPVEGDATRLHQVFSNLLSNALKFTPPAGVVSVTARAEADAAVVAIRDSGAGIAAEFLPRVFDMFRQYKERSPQGGLGLALTRQIVDRHGGTIEVRSDGVGRGAEFIVRLPWRPHSPGEGTVSGQGVHRIPGARLTSS